MKLSRFERALIDRGIATPEQVQSARERQIGANRPLLEILVEQEVAPEQQLVTLLAEVARIPLVQEADLTVDPSVQSLVPPDVAQRHGILPLHLEGDDLLVVATTDPFQLPVFDELRATTERKIQRLLASPGALRRAMAANRPAGEEVLDDLFRRAPETRKVSVVREGGESAGACGQAEEAPAIRLVDFVLADGVKKGVSDIHIEAEKDALRVRFRLDGELRDVLSLPPDLHPSVIKRLKIITGLNTIESRRPQDGRAKINHGGKSVDLRISTIPAYFGEKAVIRLLDPDSKHFHLDASGLDPAVRERWRSLLARPHGLLLVTGPTGSGKTSTLYASLLELRSPSVNIVTVEDPVEYQFPGIVHVPVRSGIGMTFAAGLRSILRQDPDVVLLGEIRDKETAEVALRAAVTGHLVLSTLHTNDAVGAITRLIDLGVPRSLLSSALLGVMSQRLVRTVCSECLIPCSYPPAALRALDPTAHLSGAESFRYGRGCASCFGTGLRGRSAIAELVVMTQGMKALIAEGAGEKDIRTQSRRDGSVPLARCGLNKILDGACSPAEVLKVVVSESAEAVKEDASSVCQQCGEGMQQGWKLCPACGHKVTVAAAVKAPSEWPCKDCGETVKEGWRNCPFCGVAVTGQAPGPAILVCDDNPVVRRKLRLVLSRVFGEVAEAADGRTALDMISRRRPQLLIIDQEMPIMTGVEAIKVLRSNLETAMLPIIMFTGVSGPELESVAFEAGADDYLTKPVPPARLVARAKALLASRRRALVA